MVFIFAFLSLIFGENVYPAIHNYVMCGFCEEKIVLKGRNSFSEAIIDSALFHNFVGDMA